MESFRIVLLILAALPQVLAITWPLWVVLGLITGVKLLLRYREQRRLLDSGILRIDRMDGRTFEQYLEVLFRKLGYRVRRTPDRGDFGADLVTEKDGIRTVVQAKRAGTRVGIGAVQEATAAQKYYHAGRALVVTNNAFTRPARELARANGVLLWDREELIRALLSVQGADGVPPATTLLSETAASTDSATAAPVSHFPERETSGGVCATCGKPLTEPVRAYCRRHPERFGGRDYCYVHQRRFAREIPGEQTLSR